MSNNEREIKVGSRWKGSHTNIAYIVTKIEGSLFWVVDEEYSCAITKDRLYDNYTHISDPEWEEVEAPEIEFGREYVDNNGWVFIPDHIFKDSIIGYQPSVPNDAGIVRLKGFNIRYRPHNWTPAHKWRDGDEAWWVLGSDEDPEEILNGRYCKGEFRYGRDERHKIKPEWNIFPTALEAAEFAAKEWKKA